MNTIYDYKYTYTSTPSYIGMVEANNSIYLDALRQIDPVLFEIKQTLSELNINPSILPSVIKSLSQINTGSGWGKVEIEVRDKKVIKCRGVDEKLLEISLQNYLQ